MEGGYYANSGKAQNNSTSRAEITEARAKIEKAAEGHNITPDSELILQGFEETQSEFACIIESIQMGVRALKQDGAMGGGVNNIDSDVVVGLYALHNGCDGFIPAVASKILCIREMLPILREINKRLATIVG